MILTINCGVSAAGTEDATMVTGEETTPHEVETTSAITVQDTPTGKEATSDLVTSEVANGSASSVAELYSGLEAPPTTKDSQSDASAASSSDVIVGPGDNICDHHDNTDDIVAPPTLPARPLVNDIITGDITDSDEELMSAKSAGKDDEWVMVERPSLTSDDQSLDSVDSIVDDDVLPEGNTVTVVTTNQQEPEEVEMTDVAMEVVDNNKHVTVEIVDHDKQTTVDDVDKGKQATTSPLLSDTANQDGGGCTADDEAEDDDVDKDWWRTKGPAATTVSVVTKQQPRWTSLKFTRQLKSRWGVTSSPAAVTMTADVKEPPKASTSPVLTSKTNELSTWFPDDDERKEPVFPSAGEIAEAKQLQEKMAAEAAAKKAKKLSPITSDHSQEEQEHNMKQQEEEYKQQQQESKQQKLEESKQQQRDSKKQDRDNKQQPNDALQQAQLKQGTPQQQPEEVKDTQHTDQSSTGKSLCLNNQLPSWELYL